MPKFEYFLYENEDGCTCTHCQEEIDRGDEVVQTGDDLICVECAIYSLIIPTT
jgi:hypothetical protein